MTVTAPDRECELVVEPGRSIPVEVRLPVNFERRVAPLQRSCDLRLGLDRTQLLEDARNIVVAERAADARGEVSDPRRIVLVVEQCSAKVEQDRFDHGAGCELHHASKSSAVIALTTRSAVTPHSAARSVP